MRKLRENLRAYGGLVSMTTVTAPGEEAGLVWDTARCSHPPGEACSGRKGCRVVQGAADVWNGRSHKWWSELNRIAKQHADRRLRALGYEKRGGLLAHSWELQRRGVWHLHIVLGMQTAPEREWARVYVETLRRIGPSKGFGFVDAKPLETPQEAKADRRLPEQVPREVESGWLDRSERDGHRCRQDAPQLREPGSHDGHWRDDARSPQRTTRVGVARRVPRRAPVPTRRAHPRDRAPRSSAAAGARVVSRPLAGGHPGREAAGAPARRPPNTGASHGSGAAGIVCAVVCIGDRPRCVRPLARDSPGGRPGLGATRERERTRGAGPADARAGALTSSWNHSSSTDVVS